MSLTTAALRELVAMGLTAEQILLVAEANEVGSPDRTARQERNRRYYEKKRLNERLNKTTEQDAVSTPLPLPSSPQTPQLPTPTPGKNTRTRKGASAEPSETLAGEDLDRIWLAANAISRQRSGRPATSRALLAAVRKGATLAAIEASVVQHCRSSPDHAKGLHRIIEAELWRDHMGAAASPPSRSDPAYRAFCEQHYRTTGEWKPEWGERPRIAA